MVFKKIYAKIGPTINEFVYPFKLGDQVEIVAGRDKGNRGPICYINEKHNYIVVKDCNIGNTCKKTLIPSIKNTTFINYFHRLLFTSHKKSRSPRGWPVTKAHKTRQPRRSISADR